MNIRAWDLVVASALGCAVAMSFSACTAQAASMPPLSGSWNIQSTGSAASSGELLFRVTPGNGDDPVEVTVSVLSGSNEAAVARTIRRTLATQLRADRYNVQLGEGANVLVTDPRGQPNFSLELLTSDVDNLRVAVQSTQAEAAPTVPPQTVPSTLPAPSTPPGPGNAVPPVEQPPAPGSVPPASGSAPPSSSAPPASSSAPPASAAPGSAPGASAPPATPSAPNPAPPPNTTGGAGQPAAAPPPG